MTSLSEVDLSGDFDPDKWDERMAELFNDEYYDAPDDGFRAAEDEYDDAEFINAQMREGGWDGGGYGDWAEEEGGEEEEEGRSRKKKKSGKAEGFEQLTARLRRGEAVGGFEGASSSKDDGASGTRKKTAQEYMDEYYGLDYEDLIGGDLPTRFKYRQVDPTGYGITDQEILHEDERSLSKARAVAVCEAAVRED